MTTVICIGECMIELRRRADGAFDQNFAGDAYNVAAYLKRSAPEMNVYLLTATGSDPLSTNMRAAWRTEGVSDALAFETPDAHPGLYMINLDAHGERTFTYWRSASAARQWFTLLQAHGAGALVKAQWICFSSISLAILPEDQRSAALTVIGEARRLGAKIVFDPNYRPALWPSRDEARRWIAAALDITDIARPSQEDLDALELELPAVAESVTTHGANGCVVRTPMQEIDVRAPSLVQAIDTSGAGDAFTGAYIAARARGADPKVAAEAALVVASRVVTAPGALVPPSISHPR